MGCWLGKQPISGVAKLLAQGLARRFTPELGWLFSLPGLSASPAVLRREGLNLVRRKPS